MSWADVGKPGFLERQAVLGPKRGTVYFFSGRLLDHATLLRPHRAKVLRFGFCFVIILSTMPDNPPNCRRNQGEPGAAAGAENT